RSRPAASRPALWWKSTGPWAYDPSADIWVAIDPMPHPRHGLGAVTLDGAVYVIGGALKASGVETSALVEIYRP
ncbi:MAG TPA: hypothetical protein PKV67_09615, partial [Hyphomonas sp.]|nr:hypothetical protein [Hyphomonas sp.]